MTECNCRRCQTYITASDREKFEDIPLHHDHDGDNHHEDSFGGDGGGGDNKVHGEVIGRYVNYHYFLSG